jgi:hypothetical protein
LGKVEHVLLVACAENPRLTGHSVEDSIFTGKRTRM